MSPVKIFIKNSLSVFSEASRGEYKDKSSEYKALKDSILESRPAISDKQSLSNDSKRVYSDARKALNSYGK